MKSRRFIHLLIAFIMIGCTCGCNYKNDTIVDEKDEVTNEEITSSSVTSETSVEHTSIEEVTLEKAELKKENYIVTSEAFYDKDIIENEEEKLEEDKIEFTLYQNNEKTHDLIKVTEEKDAGKEFEKVETVPALTVVGYTCSKVNFRNKPSMKGEVISVVSDNSFIYILDNLNTKNDFYHVVVDGYVGYINKDNVLPSQKKLYAKEKTSIKCDGNIITLNEGDSIVLFETANGSFVDSSSLKKVKGYKKLVDYKEYLESKIDTTKFELVTSFSTNYSLQKIYEGKAFNINHCCQNYINGTVVAQNEEFNWFRDIGNTGKKEGYTLANVFSGGKVVKGYGGGVCQVSSTMYNCVLNLGLKVIERHPHGMPVYYVDYYRGKDASVSDIGGGFNFVWKNTEDYDIYIRAYTYVDETKTIDKQGTIVIEFYKIII